MKTLLQKKSLAVECIITAMLSPAAISFCLSADCSGVEKLFMKGDYKAAEREWRKLLESDSAVEAATGLVMTLDMTGDYKEAIKVLESVKDAGRSDAGWHAAFADALARVGRYEEAMENAGKAVELAPLSASAIFTKGRLLEILGKKEEAKKTYKLMENIVSGDDYRKDARTLVALGRIMDRYAVLTGQRASDQAPNILHNYFQEAYQKADRNYWPANLAAAEFLLSKYKVTGAMEELSLAEKINKNLPDLHAMKAAVMLGGWRFEECLNEADKALKINPRHEAALYMKAACRMQWRKFDEVPGILEKILDFNPRHVEALSLTAASFIRMDMKDRAEEYCLRVKKTNPDSAILPQTIGRWLVSGRRYGQAEPYLLKAVELAPEKAGPLASLGKLYMETGEEKKALVYLEKARKLDDFRSDVVNYLNTARKLQEFEVKQTPHFIIKADKPDKVMLKLIADYMEQIYDQVTNDYGWKPKLKTIIEIMPTQKDFSARISGRGWIPTVGACTGRVIAIATPHNERGEMGLHNWTEVLRHEFAHTVTLGMTDNRIPHWFTEACSVWQQKDKRAFQHIKMLVTATQYGRLFPVSEINWGFIRPRQPSDRHLAYAQSEWMLQYIIITRGFEKVREMLRGFGKGYSQEKVFREITGSSEEQFDKEFRKWARKTVREWGYPPDKPPDVKTTSKKILASPDDPAVLAEHAKALYFAGKLKKAGEYIRKTRELDENNSIALRLLARIHLKNRHYEQAISVCRKLEKIDPTTRTAPDVLASCYLQMDRKHPDKYLAEAIAALELLQKRAPLNSRSYIQLANIYTKIGAIDKALPNLIHLHRHTMNNQKYARNIAEIYRAMDKLEMAKKYFMEVIYTNSFEINAYEAITSILVRENKFKDAVGVAEQVIHIDPGAPKPHNYLAKILYRVGKSSKNVGMLKRAMAETKEAINLGAPPGSTKRIQHYINIALKNLAPEHEKNDE